MIGGRGAGVGNRAYFTCCLLGTHLSLDGMVLDVEVGVGAER